VVSMRIRFAPDIDIIYFTWTRIQLIPSVSFFILISFLTTIIFHYMGLYRINIITRRAPHFTGIIKSLSITFIIYIVAQFLIKQSNLFTTSRAVIIMWISISTLLFLLIRIIIYPSLHNFLIKSGTTMKNLMIIGDQELCLHTLDIINSHPEYGLKPVSLLYIDSDDQNLKLSLIQDIYTVETASRIVKESKINHIIIATESLETAKIIKLVGEASLLVPFVELTSLIYTRLSRLLNIEWYSDLPVFPFNKSPYYRWYRYFKRFFDIIFSSLILLILSPVLFFCYGAVKISSPGPFIIKQDRIGKNGKQFLFYKIRSMKSTSVKHDNQRHNIYKKFINNEDSILKKVVDTSRLTWIGKLMRKSALDEIPQLFNVIKGDMSLVGPRPCLPQEYVIYDKWHRKRYEITPGCTGIWQVVKHKGTSFSDTVLLDIYYINKVSPWLDIQLIIQTIWIILIGKVDA
jgi:exopolysaccharide biosynthesis polyprenyl glycosylphosphotransferase